jgi:hypothetical protein
LGGTLRRLPTEHVYTEMSQPTEHQSDPRDFLAMTFRECSSATIPVRLLFPLTESHEKFVRKRRGSSSPPTVVVVRSLRLLTCMRCRLIKVPRNFRGKADLVLWVSSTGQTTFFRCNTEIWGLYSPRATQIVLWSRNNYKARCMG